MKSLVERWFAYLPTICICNKAYLLNRTMPFIPHMMRLQTPEVTVSRRQAMGVAASIAAAVLSSASPSLAFLGIGEDDIQAKYAEQTVRGGNIMCSVIPLSMTLTWMLPSDMSMRLNREGSDGTWL